MKEMYGVMKGDRECFEVQAEELGQVSELTLLDFVDALLCKAMEENGLYTDEQIEEIRGEVIELYYSTIEEKEELASLLEWRWTHGFEEEKEK